MRLCSIHRSVEAQYSTGMVYAEVNGVQRNYTEGANMTIQYKADFDKLERESPINGVRHI